MLITKSTSKKGLNYQLHFLETLKTNKYQGAPPWPYCVRYIQKLFCTFTRWSYPTAMAMIITFR